MKVGLGPLFAVLSGLVNIIIFVIFALLYAIFIAGGIGGASGSFPFVDQIIFNKIAFFDPNFINTPTVTGVAGGADVTSAPVYIMKGIIQQLYYSAFIISGAIFVIAAMVIGIKLAISTIASEKAHYKEALTHWLFGLVLLFTVHFLMAGIFAINEKIVEIASRSVQDSVEFKLDVLQAIPVIGSTVGKTVSSIIGGISDAISKLTGGSGNTTPTAVTLHGYGGMLMMFALKAFGGDFISSIICAILLGQTVIIIVMYVRRLFYCIILGMLAPAIVAVDVIKKTI
ncbi:hypothetical protein D3C76_937120 [compost metagenome]